MARIISIVSDDSKSGNTTIAFNLGYALKQQNKKVMLIFLDHTYVYFRFLQPKLNQSNLIVSPFINFALHKNLQILVMNDSRKTNVNVKELIFNQVSKIKKYFDFIVFVGSFEANEYLSFALHESNEVIGVSDTNNMSTHSIMNILNNVRLAQKDNNNLKIFTFLLNMFDKSDHNHLEWMLQVTKSFSKTYTFVTLPHHQLLLNLSAISVNFAKNYQWEDYVISLNKVAQSLIRNEK